MIPISVNAASTIEAVIFSFCTVCSSWLMTGEMILSKKALSAAFWLAGANTEERYGTIMLTVTSTKVVAAKVRVVLLSPFRLLVLKNTMMHTSSTVKDTAAVTSNTLHLYIFGAHT